MKTPNLELAEVSIADTTGAPSLNDAFWALDTVVQLAVISATVTAPPVGAVQGDRYIVPDNAVANEEWGAKKRQVAYYTPAGWRYRVPREGWSALVLDVDHRVRFSGSEWEVDSSGGSSNAADVSFVPAGSISSTNVQDALEELDLSTVSDVTTTKGDLIVRGASAVARLGAGADDEIIVASAAAPLGLKYTSQPKLGQLVYVNTSIPGGNTVANSSVETAIASTYTIAANSTRVGSIARLRVFGTLSTDASVAPTLRVRVKLGATTILDTTAITLATGLSNRGWSLEASIAVHATGASGTIDAQGFAEFSTAASTALPVNLANSSTLSLDTTVDQALTVSVQWGTADADNTVTVRGFAVWIDRLGAIIVPRQGVGATFVRSAGAILPPVIDIPVYIPKDCTIDAVSIGTQDGVGSCVVDIWKDTTANYPPTSGDSICGSSKPTISGGRVYVDTSLTGWTTSLSAGDWLLFHLQNSTFFKLISVMLHLKETA